MKSIDWDHVPRSRVIRYLLMHAYRAMEVSPRLYEQWLCVLSKHIASVEVLDKVRQGMAPQVSVRLVEGIGFDIMETEEVFPANAEKPDRVAIGAKRPRSLHIHRTAYSNFN